MSERKPSAKRSAKWDLDVKPLSDAERRASERVADRILGKLGTSKVSDSDTVSNSGTVSIPDMPHSDTVPSRHAPASHNGTVSESDTVSVLGTVKHVRGFTKVPNTILDSLSEMLPASEFKVYVRLFRLSWGFNEPTCTVAYDTLVERCKLGKTTVRAAISQLIRLGLLRLVSPANTAGRSPTYEVLVPGESISNSGTVSDSGTVSKSNTVPNTAPIKDLKDMNQRPSVYEIRTIAARLFEAHRNEQTFSHDRLAELVRDVLIGQGSPVDEATIEEAIRGMAS